MSDNATAPSNIDDSEGLVEPAKPSVKPFRAQSAFDPTEHEYPGRLRCPGAPITAYRLDDPDRYIMWAWDKLGVFLGEKQREILRSLVQHKKTLVVGANGPGKSFAAAVGTVAFLYTNTPANVLGTSGTYQKMKNTYGDPVHELKQLAYGLPGKCKKRPHRIEMDERPTVKFETASPKDPEELEGLHNAYTLAVIEEADKPAIGFDEYDAMDSLVTDNRDRMLVLANPPKDETNIVSDMMGNEDDHSDSEFNVIELSSWDSHNVQVELGEAHGPIIDGALMSSKIRDDWDKYNAQEWPGMDAARHSHDWEGLGARWFIRRLGIAPPTSATAHRPFYPDDVDSAWKNDAGYAGVVTTLPTGLGLDVARMGGDYNAFTGVFGSHIKVLKRWSGTDHIKNEDTVREIVDPKWDCRFAVDATPEGSGLADRIMTFYPARIRFMNDALPAQLTSYEDKWTEGLKLLGEFLENGGTIDDARLREEFHAAARTVEFNERFIKSRGPDGEDVYSATSKSDVADVLGRSPDLLDSAIMAVWCSEDVTRDEVNESVVW